MQRMLPRWDIGGCNGEGGSDNDGGRGWWATGVNGGGMRHAIVVALEQQW